MAGTTTKKVIIWIIIILFLISSGLTFVLYLIAPSETPVNEDGPINLQEYVDVDTVNIVVPTNEIVDVDTPDENSIQVVVSEDETKNGEIDTPTL
jgi:hypothetical protein